MAERGAADLLPGELAQPETELVSPFPETATVAREAREVAIAPGHVRHGVERGSAGEIALKSIHCRTTGAPFSQRQAISAETG